MYAESQSTDGATVLNFKWAGDEPLKYTNWDKGEPGESLRCVFPFTYNLRSYDSCITDPDDIFVKLIGGPWCSGTSNFNDDHRFIPCDTKAFYQECAIMNKESGRWYSDWGEYWTPSDQTGGRGCYDKQNYVCDYMKDGIDRPVYVPRPPVVGPDCLNKEDGWLEWTDGETQSHDCYFIKSFVNTPEGNNTQGLMFTEAEAYCRAIGANLVSLHSLDDEEQLFKLIKTVEKSGRRDWYWLGFSDRGSDGYRWTDGSADDYTNWAAGQPEKTSSGEECSMIMSSDDEPSPAIVGWWSDYCTSQRGVVCQVTRGEQPNAPPTVPPSVVPDSECMATAIQGETWYGVNHIDDVGGTTNKKCVLVVADAPQWNYNAEVMCQEKGGNLLAIHHRDDMDTIMNIMRQYPDGEYWIGLTYDYDYDSWDYSWGWTDGSPLNFDNFAQNQPGVDMWSDDAVYMKGNDGRWFSSNSYEDRSYVCQRWPQGAPTPPPEEVVQGGCPMGWYPYKNRCFMFSATTATSQGVDMKNWDEANAECMRTEGASLATVPDHLYNSFVYGHMYQATTDVWLGGYFDDGREFHWIDNVTIPIYVNWDTYEPNNSGGNEYCLNIFRSNGRWNDGNCGDRRPYACSMLKSTTFPDSSPPNPKNCPKGYQPISNGCYKLYSEKKSYADAKIACQNDKTGSFGYGGLATVLDIHENEYLKAVMNEFGAATTPSWIGLYFDKSKSPDAEGTKWLWEDRRPVSYTKWAHGSPVDTDAQNGCGRIQTNGEWEQASSCTVASPYICKLEADFNPSDHPDPGEDICDADWWSYGGYCYYFGSGWESWDNAVDKCVKFQGAELASIHSDEERRFIASIDRGDQWIGLRRSGDGGFGLWSDGTGLDYTSWQSGEPNGPGNPGMNIAKKIK